MALLGQNGGLLGARRVPSVNAASGVWGLNEQSLAKGVNLWPSEDPYLSSVALLLHMDGVNDSTTFTDNSSNALTITPSNGAKISTTNPKFGTGSAIFSSGAYISTPSSALFNFSGGAFTAECWVNPSTVGQAGGAILSQRIASVYCPFEIQIDGSSLLLLVGNSADNNWTLASNTATGILAANTWTHVALVGTGTTVTLYADGTSRLSTAQPAWPSQNRTIYAGSQFTGKIDDLRITKGVARYTANFTPPATAFPNP